MTDLITYMRRAGYMPSGGPAGAVAREWYELYTANADLLIRVIIDDTEIIIHVFDAPEILRWSARFTELTPPSIIIATLAAARKGEPAAPRRPLRVTRPEIRTQNKGDMS